MKVKSESEVAQSCPTLSDPMDCSTPGSSSISRSLLKLMSIEEGNGTPLQYSCLENPMDGGAWWAAVHGVAKSRTRLSDFTFTFHFHALEKEMATHFSVLFYQGVHAVLERKVSVICFERKSRFGYHLSSFGFNHMSIEALHAIYSLPTELHTYYTNYYEPTLWDPIGGQPTRLPCP